MKRVEKERHLGKISDILANFGSFVLVNFHSMTAGDFIDLRKGLKTEGCGVSVVKNSIARIALERAGRSGELSGKFQGAVLMAYSDDLVTVSRAVSVFSKSNSGKTSVICAYDDGKVLPADRVEFFASLPSLQELHMRIMCLTAYGIPMRLANCLKAVGKGKDE